MSSIMLTKSLAVCILIFVCVSSFTGCEGKSCEYGGLSTVDKFKTNNSTVQDITIVTTMNKCFIQGKMCYGYQSYPNPDCIVCFELDDPGTLYTIGSSISLDKISGGTWIDDVWWCCEYTPVNNSNIWIIDYITGNMTLIGASGSSEGLNGLAYDDVSDTLYACGSKNLFTIDMTTGAATLVGFFGISNCVMVGLACDGYGAIYGEDLATDSLYSIDLATGAATLIGSFGLDLNYGQDIAFDKEEGICYLAAFTVNDGDEGALYICNLTTAALTKIGKFGMVTTQITGFVIPYTLNKPPISPVITGPQIGKTRVYIEYTFVSDDPDDDNIAEYTVDWGDGISQQTITGPFTSGEQIKESHMWKLEGEFTIKVKAKDTNGAESNWSKLIVKIPRYKAQNKLLLNFLKNHSNLLQINRKKLSNI